ncbi:MAG: ankyrin repeat domain-containing protein [Pseudomonadota bacterium]
MKIFLSYSRADLAHAERIAANLKQAGNEVFFDRHSIKVAEDFNRVIWGEIQKAELFVFLISPNSVRPGSYALTELTLAEKKWPNPEGKVLPVVIEPIDLADIPIYASICHILQPKGNIAAEVRAEVKGLHTIHRRKKLGRAAAIIAGLLVIAVLAVLGYREYLDQVPVMARTRLAAMNVAFDQNNFVDSASRGDLDMINLFLAAGMDPNASDGKKTALMAAVGGEHFDVVTALIEANVDVNAKIYNYGKLTTALNWAVPRGQEATVRALLEAGADADAVNSAFGSAARSGRLSMLRMLLSRKVGQHAIDDAFVGAAWPGHREILLFLVDKISDRSKVACEALASVAGGQRPDRVTVAEQIETIKFLLDLGADVDAKSELGRTPLFSAVINRRPDLAKLFLENGADPNSRCVCSGIGGDWTPLTYTTRNYSYKHTGKDLIDLLLAGGADANLARKDGRTPLMLAASRGDLQFVQTLLKAGANINARSETGQTVLVYAARSGREDVLAALLSSGADVHSGNNPLHTAVINNKYRIVEILLAKGVDVNERDSQGQTALMLAAKEGNSDMVRTLLAAGARTTDKDKMGRTAEVFARRGENSEIIELLQDAAK